VSLPKPEPGLVIRYSYLWLREHRQGQDEGSKDRPCAIILALTGNNDDKQVLVVPITHSPPETPEHVMELPLAVKQHLGLDGERSWIVYSESNLFSWPGPDLRRVAGRDGNSFSYGFLPPKLFAELRRRFLELEATTRRQRISRTE
jgi:hypothetical protein